MYIGTWKVRSLYQQGKLSCILQEMEKLNLDILGVSETFWPDVGEFQSSIPTSEENYKVIYSDGKKHRKRVGLIMNRKTANSVIYYKAKSERIICQKLQAKQHNNVVIEIYAPNKDAEESEKIQFCDELRDTIKENKKPRDQLIVMGDFNAKVGEKKEEEL